MNENIYTTTDDDNDNDKANNGTQAKKKWHTGQDAARRPKDIMNVI
jgi:hypothetical protein